MHQVGGIASRIIRPFGTAFNRTPPTGAATTPRPTVTPWMTTEELVFGQRSREFCASLEHRTSTQQFGIAAKLSDKLQADRQPVGTEAAGHAHRRMSGHIEGHRPGKPVRADACRTPHRRFRWYRTNPARSEARFAKSSASTSRSARCSNACTRRNRMVRSNIACW